MWSKTLLHMGRELWWRWKKLSIVTQLVLKKWKTPTCEREMEKIPLPFVNGMSRCYRRENYNQGDYGNFSTVRRAQRYLNVNIRPNISYVTAKLGMEEKYPKKSHWDAPKSTIRYIQGTVQLVLRYTTGLIERSTVCLLQVSIFLLFWRRLYFKNIQQAWSSHKMVANKIGSP